jgi:hypothetical protein
VERLRELKAVGNEAGNTLNLILSKFTVVLYDQISETSTSRPINYVKLDLLNRFSLNY